MSLAALLAGIPDTAGRLWRALADGRLLLVAGPLLFVLTVAVSAGIAPTLDPAGETGERTLVGIQGGGPEWKKKGRVAMYAGTDREWVVSNADSYFDVTWLGNGSVLAGYHTNGNRECGRFAAPCARTGFRELAAGSGSVRTQYSYPVRGITNSEAHDVEPLGGNRFLVSDMEYERLRIVENGTVVWQWNASSFYEAPPDPTRVDWLHLNDVDVIGEGRYLVSVRNANQLLIVERGAGVQEVINADPPGSDDDSCLENSGFADRDGDDDVRCGDPGVLDHQHNPQWLGPGAVLVADSDNNRAVELHERDGRWRPVWQVSELAGVTMDWPRDADRLPNGNTLITDTFNRRVVEISPNGSVVWGIRTELIPYEADRLPAGERVGGPTIGGEGTVRAPNSDLPLLTPALVGIQAVYPRLPFWYREPQLALTGLALLLVVGGGWQRYRAGADQ
ncbi:MAG: hypothetical protein ABEH56_02945 [Salinirussus sp.]